MDQYLDKIHNDILFIMDVIDEICKKNNLKIRTIGNSQANRSFFMP